MCCTDGSGCPQHPVGTRGWETRVDAGPAPHGSPSPSFRGTAEEGDDLFPQRHGLWGLRCLPSFLHQKHGSDRAKENLNKVADPARLAGGLAAELLEEEANRQAAISSHSIPNWLQPSLPRPVPLISEGAKNGQRNSLTLSLFR
ncbi:unnamed protein product [Coccothraustes coccothraustes]